MIFPPFLQLDLIAKVARIECAIHEGYILLTQRSSIDTDRPQTFLESGTLKYYLHCTLAFVLASSIDFDSPSLKNATLSPQ